MTAADFDWEPEPVDPLDAEPLLEGGPRCTHCWEPLRRERGLWVSDEDGRSTEMCLGHPRPHEPER